MTFNFQHVYGRQKSIIFLKVLKFLVRRTDILLDKSIKFLREVVKFTMRSTIFFE